MAQVEEDIIAAGAQIIWVLEVDSRGRAGTAESCRSFMNSRGSDKGLCVGDGETMPTAGVWDRSPFAIGRGFDIIMKRSDMEILWVSTHGTPAGNDNLTGTDVLNQVRAISGR